MKTIKFIFRNMRTRIWFCVAVPLIVLTLVAAILASTALFDLFCALWGFPTTTGRGDHKYFVTETVSKEDAFNKGNALNEVICEEGFVLLKNTGTPAALPLGSNEKDINVFGKNSVNLVYGGSGSGGGRTEGAKTIYDSLAAAGFTFNAALKAFYDGAASGTGRPANPEIENSGNTNITSGETPWANYSQVLAGVNGTNVAVIVFSRIGGEGFDLPRAMSGSNSDRHYLQLDVDEEALVAGVKGLNPSKIIVVINSSSIMQIGELENDPAISAIIQMGGPGLTGVMALGRILNGEVTPSARTVDTWARNFKDGPTWNNFGHYMYDGGTAGNKSHTYIDYEEGIYVGYRYYETRGFTDGQAWYDSAVVYPFGFGLSYTSFSWEVTNAAALSGLALTDANKNTEIEIVVKVTNTGGRKGKDVVQLYVTPKYTDGGIEKPHVVLAGFEKTPLLYPIAESNASDKPNSAEIAIRFNPYDAASYDYNDANGNGFKGWEIDSGTHVLKLMENANKLKGGVSPINLEVTGGGVKYQNDPKSGNKVENRFASVSAGTNGSAEIPADTQLKDHTISGQTRKGMSRTDWTGTWPKDASQTANVHTLSTDLRNKINDVAHNNPNIPAILPKTGAPVTKQLIEMREKPIGDSGWQDILDALTFAEMKDLFNKGAFQTISIDRIGKPATIDSDGPVGWTNFLSEANIYGTVPYASQVVISSTWNKELAEKMGKSVGDEGIWGRQKGEPSPYSGWYAPGVNIHRSPFGGRNFEYYSEDGYLAGMIAARVIAGAQSKGVNTFVKHFVLNDQETNREGINTWATEQSMREIYFKTFEIAVKEGGSRGVMSAFNRIGTKWTGGDYRLLTEILRGEWGFEGAVICDFNVNAFMNAKQMAYAGGDLNLTTTRPWVNANASDAGDTAALRNAAHNILYMVVKSNAMNGIDDGTVLKTKTPTWYIIIWVIAPSVWAGMVGWGVFAVITAKRKKISQ